MDTEDDDILPNLEPATLGLAVIKIWSRLFRKNTQWPFINLLGESLKQYLAMLPGWVCDRALDWTIVEQVFSNVLLAQTLLRLVELDLGVSFPKWPFGNRRRTIDVALIPPTLRTELRTLVATHTCFVTKWITLLGVGLLSWWGTGKLRVMVTVWD